MIAIAGSILIFLALCLDFGLSSRIAIGGAKPEFLFVVCMVLSLYPKRSIAAILGFLCGVLTGSLIGANLTHYAISRTISGFCVAWSREIRLDIRYPVVALKVFLATILAGLLFMFGAAPRSLGSYWVDTIGSAVYNGVLAIPTYALLRMVLGAPDRQRN
jgi:rod shape-determining protein MreD